jgi:hypothetical protein
MERTVRAFHTTRTYCHMADIVELVAPQGRFDLSDDATLRKVHAQIESITSRSKIVLEGFYAITSAEIRAWPGQSSPC